MDTDSYSTAAPVLDSLRNLWCEVLDLEESDVVDNPHFFELGGDSVAAIRLVGLANERGLALSNAIVFEHPELEDMASFCREAEHTKVSVGQERAGLAAFWSKDVNLACQRDCNIEQADIEDIIKCTLQQDFVMKSYLKHGTYFNQMVFHFTGSESLLRDSWDCVQQRNPILRTRLVQHGDNVFQVVVRDSGEWDKGSNLTEYKSRNNKRRMGYGTPLVRFAIIYQEEEKFLVWTFLQAVVDGWTKRLIFRELGEYIANFRSSKKDVVVRPPFKSFINHIETIDEAAAMAFWNRRLKGLKKTDILFDSKIAHEPVSSESSRIIDEIPFSYEASTHHHSCSVNAAQFITYSTIAHVAWALTLGKATGLDDTFFISKRSGRQCPLPGIESIMGPTIAHTPCRIKLHSVETVETLLKRTQDEALEAVPWEPCSWMALFKQFGRARYCQSLLIPQVAETDIFARDIGSSSSVGGPSKKDVAGAGLLLSPDESLSTMQNMALGTLTELRPRSSGRLQLVAEFDTRLVSHDRMGFLLRVYARMLQEVAGASRGAQKEVTVGEVLDCFIDGSA